MDPMAMATSGDPIFWGYTVILLLVGVIIGWLFTRRGWKKKTVAAEARVADLEAAKNRMQRELNAPSEEMAALQKTADEATKKATELEAQLKATEDELVKLQPTEADDDGEKASEEEIEEESIAEVSDEESGENTGDGTDESAVADEVEEEAAVATAEDNKVADLQMQLSLLQEEFDAAGQKSAADLTQSREEAEKLDATRIALAAELAALREQSASAQEDLDQLRAQSEKVDEGSQNKEIALTEAYTQVVTTQQQLEECDERFEAAQLELGELKLQVKELVVIRGELEERVAQSRAEVASDLAALTAAQLKLKDDEIADANASIAKLVRELDFLRS